MHYSKEVLCGISQSKGQLNVLNVVDYVQETAEIAGVHWSIICLMCICVCVAVNGFHSSGSLSHHLEPSHVSLRKTNSDPQVSIIFTLHPNFGTGFP